MLLWGNLLHVLELCHMLLHLFPVFLELSLQRFQLSLVCVIQLELLLPHVCRKLAQAVLVLLSEMGVLLTIFTFMALSSFSRLS